MHFKPILAIVVFLLPAAPVAAQPAARPSEPALSVTGAVNTRLSLSLADLKGLPRKTVQVKADDGTSRTWEGVPASELLKQAGVVLGQMRGNGLVSYVLASASDGYQVVFSVGEIDPAFGSSDIIVADALDGQPLSAEQGPLRLVVPKDVRNSRSLRQLRRLEIVRGVK
jgi:DMSO/TMAO reductase YedYZ molybdopterin-dependent catalytic subunit